MDDPTTRFTALYDTHYRSVLGYALLRVEQAVAEDVAGETFLIAWRRLDDVPDPALPWLLGVARNLLRRQRDAGRRQQALAGRIAALTTRDDLADWDVAEHVVERATALAVLAGMRDADVEAMLLATWYGLRPRQAASIVGCSAAAFAVRLHRARRRLAEALRAASASPPRPSLAGDPVLQEEP